MDKRNSYFVGVDLGGTNLRAAVVDITTGHIEKVLKVRTPSQGGPAMVIDAIVELVGQVLSACGFASGQIGGVGVGIPGLIDLERGVALLLPNIPGDWPHVLLRDVLGERLGINVSLINDVRAMTIAEWTFGAGRGVDTLACYAIGTGIGGGVVIDGQLHLGLSGSAGELGHQIVELNGLPCNCGGRGCLEMYASGPAIAARAAQAVIQRRPTRIAELAGNDLNRVTVALVLQAAREGDAVANAILEQAGAYIGIAVSNTILTICPRKVVFGGGVMAASELLLAPIRRTVCERVFLAPAQHVEIVPAQLGDDAGLIGASLWPAIQTREQSSSSQL
jgi:glucokinase